MDTEYYISIFIFNRYNINHYYGIGSVAEQAFYSLATPNK